MRRASVLVALASVGLIATPVAAASPPHTHAFVAQTATARYAVTPYYAPVPGAPTAPYHVYSIKVGSTASGRRTLVTSPKVALQAIASRGKRLLVNEDTPGSGESDVAIVRNHHLHPIATDSEDFGAGFMPNGDVIYIDGSAGKVYRIAPTGRHRRLIMAIPSRASTDSGSSLSADGRFLYIVGVPHFETSLPHHIFRITLATHAVRRLSIHEPKPWHFAAVNVSPDGAHLAISLVYAPHKGGLVQRIGFAKAGGGKLHVIKDKWSRGKQVADPHGLTQPYFTADSRTVLTSYTTRSDKAGLVIADSATSSYHALKGGKGLLSGPAL